MATFYKTTGLIGGGAWSGGTGNLDAIDGASLAAGDVALTYVSGRARQYLLKESAGAVEDSPWVIIPDSNPGNLWWDLHNVGEEGIKYLYADYAGSLSAALTDIGATETILALDVDNTVSADLTSPTTLTLRGVKGCTTTLADGVTLTVNGILNLSEGGYFDGTAGGGTETLALAKNPIAGRVEIFGLNLTVTGLTDAFPEWWTANASPGATDMTTAITRAGSAVVTGGRILFDASTYLYTTLTMLAKLTWEGVNKSSTTLQSITTGNTVTLANDIRIKHLTLDGVSKVAGSVGIYRAAHRTLIEDVEITSFETNELTQYGIFCKWEEVFNLNATTGFKVYTDGSAGFNQNQYKGGRISGHSGTGLHLEYNSKAIESNEFTVDIETNNIGVVVKGTYLTKLKGCWFEGNTVDHLQIDDVGTQYNTNMLLSGCVLNTLVGGGVNLQGLNLNFAVKDCFLNSHTWTINQSRWFRIRDCYQNNVVVVQTQNRVMNESSSSTWAKNITLHDVETTSSNYEQISSGNGIFQRRFSGATTADATETTISSVALTDGMTYLIEFKIVAKQSDNSKWAAFALGGLFYANAGVAYQYSDDLSLWVNPAITDPANSPASADALRDDLWANTIPSIETFKGITSDAGITCYLRVDGANAQVRATGLSATEINWAVEVNVVLI